MKKIIACLLMIVSIEAQNVFATNRNEFGVSYGVLTHNQVSEAVATVTTAVFSLGYATKVENMYFSGSFNAHYVFRPVRFFGVGAVASYEFADGDIVGQKMKCGTVKNSYMSIMPMVTFNWFDFKVVGMYSKLGLSYTYIDSKYNYFEEMSDQIAYTETEKDHSVWFQFTPVAVEVGSPAIRGFAEFGFGCQGFVNLGLKYKF